jgi:hypothetical protein
VSHHCRLRLAEVIRVAKSEWNGGAGSFEEILLYAPASRSLVNKIR